MERDLVGRSCMLRVCPSGRFGVQVPGGACVEGGSLLGQGSETACTLEMDSSSFTPVLCVAGSGFFPPQGVVPPMSTSWSRHV